MNTDPTPAPSQTPGDLAPTPRDDEYRAIGKLFPSFIQRFNDLKRRALASEAEAKEARLELGQIHGQIGLFAAEKAGISDNLPTEETLKLLGDYIHCMNLEVAQIKAAHSRFDAGIVELLQRCQEGRATCIFTAQIIENRFDLLRKRAEQAEVARDALTRWKADHERILDLGNELFRAARATVAHLLDDPETGQEGICRNLLRIAEDRDQWQRRAVENEQGMATLEAKLKDAEERNKALEAEREAHGAEIRRWQDAIRDKLLSQCPQANIDGAGCDSGDPLEFTLTEINQAFTHLDNKAYDALRALGVEACLAKVGDGCKSVEALLLYARDTLAQRVSELEADKARMDWLCGVSEKDSPLAEKFDAINSESEKDGVRFLMVAVPYRATERAASMRHAIDKARTAAQPQADELRKPPVCTCSSGPVGATQCPIHNG